MKIILDYQDCFIPAGWYLAVTLFNMITIILSVDVAREHFRSFFLIIVYVKGRTFVYVCLRLFTLVKGRKGKAGKGTYVCLRSLREGRKRDVRLFTFVKGREGKAGKGTYVC